MQLQEARQKGGGSHTKRGATPLFAALMRAMGISVYIYNVALGTVTEESDDTRHHQLVLCDIELPLLCLGFYRAC